MRIFLLLFALVGTRLLAFSQTDRITASVLSHKDLAHVKPFEKFEVGVILPSATQEKIRSFLTSGKGLNPYLEWEIRVYAEFTNSTGKVITVDGFYTQNYESWMVKSIPEIPETGSCFGDCYNSYGGYTPAKNDYPFRIRFAPPSAGIWKAVIKADVLKGKNNAQLFVADELTFTVDDENTAGYVSVGKSHRFMSMNGRTFIPIGCNAPWPETNELTEPELARKTRINWEGKPGEARNCPEGYRPDSYVLPIVYDNYRKSLTQMADSGANYFRMIMCPTSTDIEWEKLGDYTGRLHMAQELDKIVELAEQKGFFLHWNMQLHYSFQKSVNAYSRSWTWDDEFRGKKFCYRTIPGITDPFSFLTNEEAKKYYKQRIRYILARWGYSKNIAVFELFSEISNIGSDKSDNADFYRTGDNWKTYRDWQVEMGNYIKSQYNGKIHLLTASFAGAKHNEDDLYSYSCFDVMSSNIYDFTAPNDAEFFGTMVSKLQCNLNDGASYNKPLDRFGYNIKPLIWSETGVEDVVCPKDGIERRRNMWYALFSGVSSLQWSLYLEPQNYGIFKELRAFIDQFDLDNGYWYPGASETKEIGSETAWVFQKSYAARMYGSDKQVDAAYMRSGDDNYAIGVTTNLTFNGNNSGACNFPNWALTDNIKTPETVNPVSDNVKIKGMQFDRYVIEYFYPSDLKNPIATQSDVGPNLPLDVKLPANVNQYIVLFKIHRKKTPF